MNIENIYEINLSKPYEDDLETGVTREECSICLDNDPFTYKNWAKLKVCGHMFHRHCIDLWMGRRNLLDPLGPLCPLCMRSIYDVPNEPQREPSDIYKKCCQFLCILLACGAIFVVPSIIFSMRLH